MAPMTTLGVDAAADPAAHAQLTLELAGALHHWIEALDSHADASWHVAGQPGVAWFRRGPDDTIAHRSLSLGPEVVPVLEHLVSRHRDLHGQGAAGNSHVHALVLAALYLADRSTLASLDATELVRRPVRVRAISEDDGRHDPQLEPQDGALRVWIPVLDERDESSVEPWPTVLEVAFRSGRRQRYVPWEGAQGSGDAASGIRH